MDIKSITKAKVMKVFDTGILIVTNNNEKYKFGSFGDRNMALDRILALWTSRVPADVVDKNVAGTELADDISHS